MVVDRKFRVYKSLSEALRRSKVPNYGATSTILLEAFLEESGRITASKAISRGVCNEGGFSVWRKQLIEKRWIIWTQNQEDKGLYLPGKKLINYLNKEKLYSKELVTKDEVLSKRDAATKDELQDLKARMNRIESVVQELQKAVAPPDTEEKRNAREAAAKKLFELTKAN